LGPDVRNKAGSEKGRGKRGWGSIRMGSEEEVGRGWARYGRWGLCR